MLFQKYRSTETAPVSRFATHPQPSSSCTFHLLSYLMWLMPASPPHHQIETLQVETAILLIIAEL